MKTKRPLPDGQDLRREYRQGATLSQLRVKYRVSSKAIRTTLIEAGAQIRAAAPPRFRIDPDYLRAGAAKNLTTKQMAQVLGCNEEAVRVRMVQLGIPRLKHAHWMAGEKNQSWKGGRKLDKSGYVLVRCPNHPHAACGYVREHRLVMEKILGRYLLPSEVVHHRDKNRQNNDPSNLRLFHSNADHLRAELTGHVPNWTEDGRRRIVEGCQRGASARAANRRASGTYGFWSRRPAAHPPE